ncbi:MAG: thioredoxin family protein [Bacteroidaceae bacterium]|nr:thioredoxin family protein [Bacteroidaceae bacterium]
MKKSFLVFIAIMATVLATNAQATKVYDETIDPMRQIDKAVAEAQASNRYVICQVGGNWCPWCLRLADFVQKDSVINATIEQNFVYIHVNYPRKGAAKELMSRLNNAGRFGYPALVVMDEKGNVIHIQDSSFLEEGKGYNKEKVLRFLKGWTPAAVCPKE